MYCFHCMERIDDGSAVCPVCGKSVYNESQLYHLSPGTLLNGKYLVGKVLGEGGFGLTYIGRDINLDLKIAIKEYYPNGFANRNNTATNDVTIVGNTANDYYSKGRERFLQEARTLAKFSHDPNIVNVRDFFELNNTAYIIMEYLEGPDLKHYLKTNGKLSPDFILDKFIPVLEVLEKVHAQGLIHRDISPDNIIVENDRLILIDFGASRTVESQKSLSVVLKPGYAPGEQYYSHGNQGPWTDVYAICATMYKCMTNVTPPESSERMFEDKILLPSALGVNMPKHMENAIMKGLANRYQERQPDMRTLIKEMTGQIGGDSVRTEEPNQSVHISDNNDITAQRTQGTGDRTVFVNDNAGQHNAPNQYPVSGQNSNAGNMGNQPVGRPPVSNQQIVSQPIGHQPPVKQSGKKPTKTIIMFSAIGAAVIAVIIVIVLIISGLSEKLPERPSSKQVLSNISEDGSIHDMITSFEVSEWKESGSGYTQTAICNVDTEKDSYRVSVIYELDGDEWECTQIIVNK